jgi:hypothetical protein
MNPDLTKEEMTLLVNHLRRELKYFKQTPLEWDFWKSTYRLDELDATVKKIEKCIEDF